MAGLQLPAAARRPLRRPGRAEPAANGTCPRAVSAHGKRSTTARSGAQVHTRGGDSPAGEGAQQ
eukprot:12166494-Alexandrium_andersonii.AAC.1